MPTAPAPIGWHVPAAPPRSGGDALLDALQRLDAPFAVVQAEGGPAVSTGGETILGGKRPDRGLPLLAWVPELTPDRLGSPAFREAYGVRANYVAGEMANGIGSAEIVIAMARAGMIGFFGAAGLPIDRIAQAIDRIHAEIGELPCGFNLIHSPSEPHHEQATVDLYLAKGVRVVCAAAFLKLTPAVVQYRVAGLEPGPDGVRIRNRLIAKVSREEVAGPFLRPAPEAILRELVERRRITAEQAKLAARVPLADDLTAEADSGGHTDNRPSLVLMPLMLALRDRLRREHGYAQVPRVGAAGGLGSPLALAAAFAGGADYVVTGTINQACTEAGTSPMVKRMLAEASATDVDMAPASDMFEGGVQVQVLKRGTMFSRRGHQLYQAWRAHGSWAEVPADDRKRIESQVLRRPYADVWQDCVAFFSDRDPSQLERARREPKHEMALVFRWYLGMGSRWAIRGEEDRKADVQVWCGPAIGAFNDWTRGTFLADPVNRGVVTVAANLMAGAAAITRARLLLSQGVDAGPEALRWVPRPIQGGPPPEPPTTEAIR